MQSPLYIAYGQDIRAMTRSVLDAARLEERIPSKTALIGIKPNLVVAKPASLGATTHPEMVAALVEYLQEKGFANLMILEGSWVGDSTRRAFRACGYEDIARTYGVELFDTKGDRPVRRECDGMSIEVCSRALDVDFLINLPVMKGHCQTKITGALKNMKGLISDAEKRRFHTLGLHRPIAALNKLLRCHFVLVDGICGDLDFEEGGNPVPMNRIIGGFDAVLVDAYLACSMGYAPDEIGYIVHAARLGVGSMDVSNANIVELNHDETPFRPTPSRRVRQLAGHIDAKDACSACYANLIHALARLDDEQGLPRDMMVRIGQGYRGEDGRGPGIGRCTAGLCPSLSGCPPRADAILRFLRENLR
ncbi:MAG: DUF362 domain-containing protein [Eubacteriales bacterium]|nr:DUF362 domain-containing protein [Eubacteriales bacterium]